MDKDIPQPWTRPALRALGFLVLTISPIGAPLIGYFLLGACDIPWEGRIQCVLPTALLNYFMAFTILPVIWVGPFLAMLWLMFSLAVLLACFWNAGRAVWQATMDRE